MLEKTLESLLACKEIKPVNPKGNQPRIFIGRTDTEYETAILWPPDVKSWLIGKDPDAEKKLKVGEGDDRQWDGWMASPTWWTWVWATSGSWWWIRKPGVLQSMGSQRVRHDSVTELNWTLSYMVGQDLGHPPWTFIFIYTVIPFYPESIHSKASSGCWNYGKYWSLYILCFS